MKIIQAGLFQELLEQLHMSVFDFFSQQLETVMMIADESGRFGDQYGQSFPQLGHKKVGFPCVSIMFEYL